MPAPVIAGSARIGRRRVADLLWPERFFQRSTAGAVSIPIYMFHQVTAREWQRLCRTIRDRRLPTLTAEDLLDEAASRCPAIVLTLDDGWSSVWSIAFPIARRFGVQLTVFLVPELVIDSPACRSTLDDGVPLAELVARDHSPASRLTWGEVRALHASGLVDVQSHSLHHGMVFVSNQALAPDAAADWPSSTTPLLLRGNPRPVFALPAGMRCFPAGPALAAPRRYLEPTIDQPGRWETEDERRARMRQDLMQAKAAIEAHLPGKKVTVLAPPWAMMHPELPLLAAAVGYRLILLGYPYAAPAEGSLPINVRPRLKGDAIWLYLNGPVRGAPSWLLAQWQARRRVARGDVP